MDMDDYIAIAFNLFVVGVFATILGAQAYYRHQDEMVLKADTCEKAVILSGGNAASVFTACHGK